MTPHNIRAGQPIGSGDFPDAILRGTSPHFQVFSDPSLGRDGIAIATGVLANCERDYNRIKNWFGGIDPDGLPLRIIIADMGGAGAYHYGCDGMDVYCDVQTTP